jgi:hypothetical protein
MSEPVDPSLPPVDPAPVPPASPEVPDDASPAAGAPAAAAAAFTPPALSAFDLASRTVLGGAALAIVAALLGVILEAWEFQPFALAIIVLAIIAAGAAYSLQALSVSDAVKPWQPVVLAAAGATATAISALAVVEMIGDLDDLEAYGGFVGFILGILVLAGSIAILQGGIRGTLPNLRGAERGAQLAGIGIALVLLAWVLHLTIGFWAFAPAVWGILAIVLAATLVLFGSTEEHLPDWVGWVAVVLGLFAAWTALGQWGSLMELGATEVELGIDDIVPFLIYVAGIILVIAGGALHAMGGKLAIPSRTTTP